MAGELEKKNQAETPPFRYCDHRPNSQMQELKIKRGKQVEYQPMFLPDNRVPIHGLTRQQITNRSANRTAEYQPIRLPDSQVPTDPLTGQQSTNRSANRTAKYCAYKTYITAPGYLFS
ncbi:hypothetical protein DPMN_040007 [Dreissena polymorpha]|uniref:Uncharacterized protein n=1 Tax=Dreissena polymorpha TaxID=45954 RepID=A0A9D4CU95_DREPO|nr:hypothetical protein DPMN_040007 [Dreissena polymorpha]